METSLSSLSEEIANAASDKERLSDQFRSNWIWPFRQVLTYCVNNNTRYGYILTPAEAVVLRVYEDPGTPGSPWRVQHAAIPWEWSGEGTLTMNLAIWALYMMSLNDEHRAIRTSDQTLPLNIWWIDPSRNGARPSTYEHHLSGAKVSGSERPEGAEARLRPPPAEPESSDEEDTSPRRSNRVQY
jgi:hypothetical protein